MEAEQKADLAAQIKRIAASGKTYFYWLCPKGEDDEPVLLLEKKEGPLAKAAKAARKAAKVKIFSRGQVAINAEKELQFVHQEGSLEPKKAGKVLKTKLGPAEGLEKVAVRLKKAKVITMEEFQRLKPVPGAAPEEDGPAGDSESKYGKALDRWEELVEEARDTLGSSHALLAELAADTARAEQEKESDIHRATESLASLAQGFENRLSQAVKAAWKAEVEEVKPLFVKARDHIVEGLVAGGMDPDQAKTAALEDQRYKRMKEAQQAAYDLKAKDLQEALDALEKVEAMAEDILGSNEKVDDADLKALYEEMFDIDFGQSREALDDAFEAVDKQVTALQVALRTHADARLQRIGELGFNAVTGNHKTPLMAALLEAKMAGGNREARDKAARRAAVMAKNLRDHLNASPLLRAMADPPQGLPAVRALDLLTPALDELADIL
ncbi:MAG: hypothetical protein H6736_18570 [Alphaproteobacteria bacterium]|nr:hypothetical protein [Alphaproteobacteria bacterium]MCB9693821.1 hypothetical protein [Alphaproteobacteria bacterium]